MKQDLQRTPLSRRDALRYIALSPLTASLLSTVSSTAQADVSTAAPGHIVIAGGGAGALMVLARLRRALSKPNITLIAPNENHIYQPGQIFVAAGEYQTQDIIFDNSGYIGEDVRWIKEEVKTFDPDHHRLTTQSGQEVTYDFLIVATGVQTNYEQIEGLTAGMIGKNGISSVYLNDLAVGTAKGGEITHSWFNDVREASKTSKPRVLCTQPSTPIKCGGAPQKILYLCDDYLRKEKRSAEFIFATAGENLFSLPEIDEALHKAQERYGNITNKFSHNLIRIDPVAKTATFHHKYEVQGEYDKELQEYDVIDKEEEVTLNYDFIHITPPMSAVDAVADSLLAWQKGTASGWLEVDRETLQHRRYPNVFGIGDTCGIPIGKTGGSARHQAPVVVENLVSVMNGAKPSRKYDGYTVCPLKTAYGEIIMAEFNYDGLAPSFQTLNPATPRWLWWEFDLYALQPLYRYSMLNGMM